MKVVIYECKDQYGKIENRDNLPLTLLSLGVVVSSAGFNDSRPSYGIVEDESGVRFKFNFPPGGFSSKYRPADMLIIESSTVSKLRRSVKIKNLEIDEVKFEERYAEVLKFQIEQSKIDKENREKHQASMDLRNSMMNKLKAEVSTLYFENSYSPALIDDRGNFVDFNVVDKDFELTLRVKDIETVRKIFGILA